MKIEWRKPSGRKTALARDAGALRVMARAAELERREAAHVDCIGDPPPGRSALDRPIIKKPWIDRAKISAKRSPTWGFGSRGYVDDE